MDSNQIIDLSFRAKWTAKVIMATQLTPGVYGYVVDVPFIPVNEVYKPYNLPDLSDSEAVKALHGSTAADLTPAYNGINLDLSLLVLSPVVFKKRVFNNPAATLVQDGDSLMVFVMQ